MDQKTFFLAAALASIGAGALPASAVAQRPYSDHNFVLTGKAPADPVVAGETFTVRFTLRAKRNLSHVYVHAATHTVSAGRLAVIVGGDCYPRVPKVCVKLIHLRPMRKGQIRHFKIKQIAPKKDPMYVSHDGYKGHSMFLNAKPRTTRGGFYSPTVTTTWYTHWVPATPTPTPTPTP